MAKKSGNSSLKSVTSSLKSVTSGMKSMVSSKKSKSDWLFYVLVAVGVVLLLAIAYLLFSGKCFEAFTTEPQNPKLTYYYLPNCGHCKEFEPVWDQLADALAEKQLSVDLIKTELTSDNDEDITGAPTVILKKGDTRHEITERELSKIVSQIDGIMNPPASS